MSKENYKEGLKFLKKMSAYSVYVKNIKSVRISDLDTSITLQEAVVQLALRGRLKNLYFVGLKPFDERTFFNFLIDNDFTESQAKRVILNIVSFSLIKMRAKKP